MSTTPPQNENDLPEWEAYFEDEERLERWLRRRRRVKIVLRRTVALLVSGLMLGIASSYLANVLWARFPL
jgi:hypothetical protein